MTKIEEMEDVARRGTDAYERLIRPRLRPEDDGKFVAIDIDTGEYELDADDYEATERMLARKPGANLWMMRVGRTTAYRMKLLTGVR